MAIPTDDLTVAHLDATTDDPSQARAEILAAVNKIKTLLPELGIGETNWNSGNDGPGSGLNADLLDGQEGSYYRNASNINAGTLSNSRLSTGAGNGLNSDLLDGQHGSFYQNAANLNAGYLSALRLAGSVIDQSKLKTQFGEVTTDTNPGSDTKGAASTIIALPGGTHGFLPRFKVESGGWMDNGIGAGNSATYKNDIVLFNSNTGDDRLVSAEQYYIEASPPYDLGDGEVPFFVFLNYSKKEKKVKGFYCAGAPPWAYNGPTSITPSRVSSDGRKFKLAKSIDSNGRTVVHEVEIDSKYKNKDMKIIPHPFFMSDDFSVMILDPCETLQLKELHESGESISRLFKNDYIKIDNSPIERCCPNGVLPCKFVWKNIKGGLKP